MPARASHYVVRPGPTSRLPSGMVVQEPCRFVPLIAVDQLPDWLEVVGVPRQLPFAQAVDMIAIGGVSRPSDCLIHDAAAVVTDDVFEVRLLRRNAPASGSSGADIQHPDNKSTAGDSDAWPREDNSVSSWGQRPSSSSSTATSRKIWTEKAPRATKTAKTPKDPLLRQPCRHWCQTGHCSFKTGCKFKHAMPSTAKGLRDVGLHRLPDWYEELMGRTEKTGYLHHGNTHGKQGSVDSYEHSSSGGGDLNSSKQKGRSGQVQIPSIVTMKNSAEDEASCSSDQKSDLEWDVAMGDIRPALYGHSSMETKTHSNETVVSETVVSETTNMLASDNSIPYHQHDDVENLLDL